MRILISGAGIAGLSAAAFLRKKGCEVDIIEKAPKLSNIGFGIGIWPNGMKMLNKLGIGEEIKKMGVPIKGHSFLKADESLVASFDFKDIVKKYGEIIVVDRATLHNNLLKINDELKIKFNTEIANISEYSKKVRVALSNGEINEYDIVVGADGVHSKTRELLFPKSKVKKLSVGAWMCWIPKIIDIPNNMITIIGKGKVIAISPSQRKEELLVTIVASEKIFKKDSDANRNSLISGYLNSMGGKISEMLRMLPDSSHIFPIVREDILIKKWHAGRIILIGDAARTSSPLLGMGASMAMEDAYVLAEELSTLDSVDFAFQNYTARRSPRFEEVKKLSDKVEFAFTLKFPLIIFRDAFMPIFYRKFFLQKAEEILSRRI